MTFAGVLRSPFVPTVVPLEAQFIPLMTWRREWGGGGNKTAYGSASYIKEATCCAVIHCQFALFVSCSPSSLPHSPRWLSRGNKGTSVVPTPSPSLVEPPFNELHTVSTAKSGLLLSNGISPLLSALGRASRSALSLQNTSTLPSATSQTGGGGGWGVATNDQSKRENTQGNRLQVRKCANGKALAICAVNK